jgi:hypothetical protein
MQPLTGFDFFEETEAPLPTKRDEAFAMLRSLKKGDTFKLGGSRWTVSIEQGITKLLIKAGTKGKKLYYLDVLSDSPLEFGVREVIEGGARYSSVVEARGLIIPELK